MTGAQLPGNTTVSGFSAMSSSGTAGATNFAGVASQASGALAGTTVADIGLVEGPNGAAGTGNDPGNSNGSGNGPGGDPTGDVLSL